MPHCPCLPQVWHGRWNETDVAVIMLGSLSVLGVPAVSVQRDAAGGALPSWQGVVGVAGQACT